MPLAKMCWLFALVALPCQGIQIKSVAKAKQSEKKKAILTDATVVIESVIVEKNGAMSYLQNLGTLISPLMILTTAHPGHEAPFATIGEETIAIRKIHVHPDYKTAAMECDLALMELERKPAAFRSVGVTAFDPREDRLKLGYFIAGAQSDEPPYVDNDMLYSHVDTKIAETDYLVRKSQLPEIAELVDTHELGDPLISFYVSTSKTSPSNFLSESGDSGGGLFDDLGLLVGVHVANTELSSIKLLDFGTCEAAFSYYIPITNALLQWIDSILFPVAFSKNTFFKANDLTLWRTDLALF